MEQLYGFDFVEDTQSVFRQLLEVLSKPFTIGNIGREAGKFPGQENGLWAIGCTLLDNETGYYVEKNRKLAEALTDLTLSEQTAPGEADYIFLSSPLNYETIGVLFEKCKKGTLEEPHCSATFLIFTPQISGKEKLVAKGPGIKEEKEVYVDTYVKNVCLLHNNTAVEYPCGFDLFFLDAEGNVMGVPRLVKIK